MSVLDIKRYGVTKLGKSGNSKPTSFMEDVEFIMSGDRYDSYEFDNKSDRDAKAEELEALGYFVNKYSLL